VPLPSNASEPFVGQIELVSILADKPIRYGALLGNDLGHPEGGDDALQAHREPYLEPVNPLGLRSAPAEGSLPAEEPFARSSHPHDGRDEGSIQHVVGGRGLGQSSVSTAESASKAGRPGLGVSQEREASHQSAADISVRMYESYVLDRYWLRKVVSVREERLIFEPIRPG